VPPVPDLAGAGPCATSGCCRAYVEKCHLCYVCGPQSLLACPAAAVRCTVEVGAVWGYGCPKVAEQRAFAILALCAMLGHPVACLPRLRTCWLSSIVWQVQCWPVVRGCEANPVLPVAKDPAVLAAQLRQVYAMMQPCGVKVGVSLLVIWQLWSGSCG